MRIHEMHDSNRSMPTTEAAVKTKLPELITKAEALKHALHAALTFQAEAAWKRIDANQKAKLTKASDNILANLTPWQKTWLLTTESLHTSSHAWERWVPELQNFLKLWPQVQQLDALCKQTIAPFCAKALAALGCSFRARIGFRVVGMYLRRVGST